MTRHSFSLKKKYRKISMSFFILQVFGFFEHGKIKEKSFRQQNLWHYSIKFWGYLDPYFIFIFMLD